MKLYGCTNKRYLRNWINNNLRNGGFEKKYFMEDVKKPGKYLNLFQKEKYISKKTGKMYSKKPSDYNKSSYRKIHLIEEEEKYILRALKFELDELFSDKRNKKYPKYLYSKENEDYVRNAKGHLKSKFQINMDLENFFDNCTAPMVKNFFCKSGKDYSFNCDPDIAYFLTNITTRNNPLKKTRTIIQGAPTSTILAFLAYKDMFDEIFSYSKENGVFFSLYVDDLSFSYKELPLEEDVILFCKKIAQIVESYGHKIQDNKTVVSTYGIYPKLSLKYRVNTNSAYVTGISVNSNSLKPGNKMISKMYKNISILRTHNIYSHEDYFKKWKAFVSIKGQLNTLEYIAKEDEKKQIYKMDIYKQLVQTIEKYNEKFPKTLLPSDFKYKTKTEKIEVFKNYWK